MEIPTCQELVLKMESALSCIQKALSILSDYYESIVAFSTLKEFKNELSVHRDLENISSLLSSIWELLNNVILYDYKEKNTTLPDYRTRINS